MTSFAAEFTEWRSSGWHNVGMRHRVSGKRHGIVRRITNNENIGEGTFKDGKCHGLNREISSEKVTVELRKDGKWLAHFSFTFGFDEIERKDPSGLLNNLYPQDFMWVGSSLEVNCAQ